MHGEAVARQGGVFLAQAVVEFAVPFAAEESDDGEVPVHERGAVAPRGIDGGNLGQSAGGARGGAGAGEAGRADWFGRGMVLSRAEAGGAKMTRDHPFASKEALIVALWEKRDREPGASTVATVEAAGKSRTKRLLAVFDGLEAWFGSPGCNGCVFIRALSEYPGVACAIHRPAWNHTARGESDARPALCGGGGQGSRCLGRGPEPADRRRHRGRPWHA